MNDSDAANTGNFFEFVGLAGLLIPLILLVICGIVAALVAQDRGLSGVGYFCLGFFLLGPLAVAVALLVPPTNQAPRSQPPAGRRRFVCPRCEASQNIPDEDTGYDCWRCGEHRTIKPTSAVKP